MNVIVFGSTGMLGGYVSKYLGQNYKVTNIDRRQIDVESESPLLEARLLNQLYRFSSKDSIIVNCIGMIKPQVDKYGVSRAIQVNSVFPRKLANYCQGLKDPINMIHITTDCVFAGKPVDVPYTEKSLHDATDVYGKTKSLGEPENCTVIRTSIIGEEKETKRSLVEWIKSNTGKPVNGYINHCWNGVTCLQLAKVIEEMIVGNLYWQGVRHVFTPQAVTKYTLVDTINTVYDLNMSVAPVKSDVSCDRTMGSIHGPLFQIPSLEEQIKEMREFKL